LRRGTHARGADVGAAPIPGRAFSAADGHRIIRPSMITEALAEQARAMSRREFVTKHAGHYLWIGEGVEMGNIGFETAAIKLNDRARMEAAQTADFEVLPLVKAPGNPYADRISVGRARNCDVVMRHPSISKLHAHFRKLGSERFDLVDL